MAEKPEWAIKIKRTITVGQVVTSRSYPGMTIEQAINHEVTAPDDDVITYFLENLEYILAEEISVKVEVTPEG